MLSCKKIKDMTWKKPDSIGLTLLMLFTIFITWNITHHGCYSRHLPFPWGTQGTTGRRHANNDAREINNFIGCEGDFPNFYDVIRLKIIESMYFPKETVMVGLAKSNQYGEQLKETKLQWISSREISNLDAHRDFFR